MKVFLNPGHDRNCDPGACGNGLKEAEVVWEVCQKVEQYLLAAGVKVVGNLQDDNLNNVVAAANSSDADVFVSVHCNAAGNTLAAGTETFAIGPYSQGKSLAAFIQMQIVVSAETLNRGVKFANFFVLKYTSMPAVLVELAFLSNPNDAELLRTRLDEFAKAIARGVTDYEQCVIRNA